MTDAKREWRPFPGFPKYEISEDGLHRRDGKILKPETDKDGYHRLFVSDGKTRKKFLAHRIVALAFIGTPPTSDHQVAHGDNNRKHNHFSNLRWATCLENQHDRYIHGTSAEGVRNGRAILTEEAVREIRSAKPYRGYRKELAARFGVAPMTISCIRWSKGKWANVR